MEDVLDVYKRPYDPKRPQICMDETSKQLLADTREPIPMKPGDPERYDYEYNRKGVANLFMFCEPLRGKRTVKVTERRTRIDWALALKEIADEEYPDAEVIVLVMDNLNTHSPASFYEAFEPQEARRLTNRFEIHYTPKHGSWLNMAEIEFSALNRQCLDRRIPTKELLESATDAWVRNRNEQIIRVNWQFTTEDARIKLKHLYPQFQL